MIKKFQRILSGVLAAMFVGQVMIYGDGSSQGIAHAETISEIKESLQLSENADALQQEYENSIDGLGEVDYFGNPEEISLYSSDTGDVSVAEAGGLAISGYVGQYGTYSDLTKVKILIFDGWDLANQTTANASGFFTISTYGLGPDTNVKIECDGYLPRFYKGMGYGSYWIGSSEEPEMLLPGDTTWNEEQDNQWSDEQINSADAAYVQSCLGAYVGDSDFNPSMDVDGDNIISQADLNAFCAFYENLGDTEYELPQYICDMDMNADGVINETDYEIFISNDITEEEYNNFVSEFNGIRQPDTWAYIYNHEMTGNIYVNADDYSEGINKINTDAQKRGRSENYYEYMDKNENGTIDQSDCDWFANYGSQYAGSNSENSYKKNIKLTGYCYNPGAFSLHDANLDINGQILEVEDCMYFTTDNPSLWSGNKGATLDLNGGGLWVHNNFVFRTASPDGWGGNAGMDLLMNGGFLYIDQNFDFGQANCYDRIIMTNAMDELEVDGNWQYITLADMEGQWTAGHIYFLGPVWQVNEASGPKSVYSSGDHIITFYYEGGKQTILWDNCETYIDNEDGSYNTERRFNFEGGIDFPYGYSEELYWFRPWWRPYDDPDYTLYRKGWEIGDGVHIATGNYTKTFTDLSIESPGVQSDFIRTYNSTSDEEGSFGIGWDFNIGVSKIVIPAEGYYQVVLPDGSNTTFKDAENGGYECLNAHSTMTKNGGEYIVTNAAQSKYYFNADGEMYKVEDAEGNKLTISAMENNQRIVMDSTDRTYKIYYNGNSEHSRVTKIEDTAADRAVVYEYNSDFQLISATNVAGGKETYSYDSNGHMNKITNCYDEVTDQITYFEDGKVDYLVNASGLKQVYTYDKAKKQTGTKEYDGDTLVKTFTYDYDEKYAVKTNKVETDGQTYDVDKITYKMVDDENKYDEMVESVDIRGNVTKYDRDDNGNITKTTNPDGTFTLANYNSKNNLTAAIDAMGYATIKAYDKDGVRLIKEAQSLNPLSQSDINTVTAKDFNPVTYLAENESSYAITSHEYYADSYVSGVIGLIQKTTDPEGNITEYDYYKSGNGKGLVSEKWVYGNGISKPEHGTRYEYNAQLHVSKETSSEGYVKEYEYDKFNNVTVTRDYGTGSDAAVTIAEYDKLSRKIAEYAPNYSVDKSHGTLTSYYPDDNKKTDTDAEGNVTFYKYDAYGNVIEKTNPDGTINVTEYDGLQREKATYFKSGADAVKQILTSTEYEFVKNHGFDVYTALDSCSSKSCSGLKTIKKTYITDDKQVVNETLADWKENTVYEKTNGETKRTNAYYANGQLARQTDALDNTIKYEYGTLNKLTKTYTPFNGKEKYSVTENQYDKNGNVILTRQTVQKEDSSTVKYSITQNEYNGLGLLSKVTLSGTGSNEKNITQYFYNHDGIETEMRTGLSSDNDTSYLKTEYVYDSRNHLVRTKDSTGYNSGTITYDLNGNVLTNTDSNGNVTTNTYDALNRVLTANTVNSSDSSKNVSKSYTYDNMGRITQTVSNNLTTSTIYDSLGRKYTETEYDGNGYSIFRGYFYEGISQYLREELTGQYHLLLYSSKTYEYDGEMHVVKVKESGEETVSYTYDANGNKKSETLANGVVSTYTYNNNNKVTGITNKKENSTISSYEYSYYLDGSDACKVRSENGIIETTSYEYDGLKRLTEESVAIGNSTDTYSYEYDDYGNRSKMTAAGSENYVTEYSYSDSNGNYTALLQKEVKTVEGEENPLDFSSNVKQTVYTYDANGNQITKTAEGKTETNTYDGLNQLIGFTDGETTASYAYNVDGLRYEKIVDGQRINHVWDGSKQIIADVIDNQFYEADCYIRGTNLVAKYNYRNGDKSEYTYYTQNAHGDVVNLTNANGEVTKTYKYNAFGVEKDISESDTNAFRYCGEYYDTESGTIYLRARYYDPSIGRFISRDSFAGKQGDPLSLNRYTYCHNSPVVFVDCNGNFPFLPQLIGAGVGALISGGSKIISNVKNGNDWYDGVGKAALSGAVSGVILTIPIPGAGPLASAVITGGASNLAADAINGDINSFKDAALSFTEGAAIGAVTHGVGKWADKKLAKPSPNSQPLSQCKSIDNPAHSAAQYDKLKTYYKMSQKHGKGGVRELPDGRYRFYDTFRKADKPGEMSGARYVREWNPSTGKMRGWNETLDHAGRVRQVRPDVSVTGGSKVHYQFDRSGRYTGKW